MLIAVHANAEALRRSEAGASEPVVLTKRQAECLKFAAQGKSDWAIGKILGISARTVHNTIEHAKLRYGVSHRVQAVSRALLDGAIEIDDLAG